MMFDGAYLKPMSFFVNNINKLAFKWAIISCLLISRFEKGGT